MPLHQICDGGCGATTATPEEWPEHGYAHKTRYCPKCEEGVVEYEKGLNELHDKVQKQWASGLKKVKDAYLKDNPKGALPDVGT